MWIALALLVLTVSVQAEKVSSKVDTEHLISKIHKASFVPDFATRTALNFFQKANQDSTNSTSNSTSQTNSTVIPVNPTNNTEDDDGNDYSFLGGFTASLAMICFAEFGDRVFLRFLLTAN